MFPCAGCSPIWLVPFTAPLWSSSIRDSITTLEETLLYLGPFFVRFSYPFDSNVLFSIYTFQVQTLILPSCTAAPFDFYHRQFRQLGPHLYQEDLGWLDRCRLDSGKSFIGLGDLVRCVLGCHLVHSSLLDQVRNESCCDKAPPQQSQ